ncbi:MAG TPA: winged helix-turn-helix domain-containing protein [Thermoanaerobaculia bacterium]|nr:winged helix-turn-helix domain-containing protein [Thermoanaerobaculia bacterium]
MRYRFGPYELDAAGETLHKSGIALHLTGQPFRVLLLLVSRAGEVVSREEIQKVLWVDGTFVDYEQGINTVIRHIRQTLNDAAAVPRYLETIPRRGYRFIAPVELVPPAPVQATIEWSGGRSGRRLSLVVLVVALVALIAAQHGRTSDHAILVGVVPFRTLTPGLATDAYAKELASVLGRLAPRVTVVEDPARFGEAGVVLEGTLQRTPASVRAILQARDPRTRAQLWSETFERSKDLSDFPVEIAYRVATAVGSRHLPPYWSEPALHAKPPAEALALYRQARSELARPPWVRDLDRARVLLERSVKIDPRFAEAWSGLASVAVRRAWRLEGKEHAVLLARARDAAARALALQPRSAEALHAMGLAAFRYDFDFAAGESLFRRAIAADPRHWEARVNLALLLPATARHDEALAELAAAERLAPQVLLPSSVRPFLYFLAHRFKDAERAYRELLVLHPESRELQLGMMSVALAQGRRELLVKYGGMETAVAAETPGSHYVLAAFYAELGETARALDALERATARREPAIVFLRVDPRFDAIRQEPRFAACVGRLR